MTKLRKEIGDRKIELESLESAAAQLRQQLGTGAPEDWCASGPWVCCD
jgi:hypothetical protein